MIKLAIAATLLFIVSPATAQTLTAADQADGRCVAALMTMSDMAARRDKAAFDSGMMYFLGKLAGRSGKAAMSAAIGAAAVTVSKTNAPATAERCVAEIEVPGNAM